MHRESNGSCIGQYHTYCEQSEQYELQKARVLVHKACFMKAVALTADNVDAEVEEAMWKDDHI